MRAAPTDDDDLARRAAERDEKAFEELFARHRDGVYGLALRLTADPVEAEEATAEAFAAAWFGLPEYTGRAPFGGWLRAILANRVRQRRRAAARRARRFVPTPDPEGWERAVRATFPGTRIDVERAIAALPERARETVLLRHAAGLSYAQIADAMSVTIGTVKSQLARGYAIMRERLSK